MSQVEILVVLYFAAALLTAAACDVCWRRIPNRLVFALAAGAPAWHLINDSEPLHWLAAAVGATVVLGLGIGLYAAGWLGAGDGKLAAAAALWLGPAATLQFLAWTALAGGALSLLLLAWPAAANPVGAAHRPRMRGTVPYGVALAAGGLIALPVRAGGMF